MIRALLVGNAALDRQQSMLRFADLVGSALTSTVDVTAIAPPALCSAGLAHTAAGWRKWVGYIDKHVLFPPLLAFKRRRSEIVHVLDHSNALYVPRRRAVPWVVTCHDLLAVRSALGLVPGRTISRSGRAQQALIRAGIARADLVVSVSDATDADVGALLNVPAQRRMVVPNALNRTWKAGDHAAVDAGLRRLGRDPSRPYVLHVGGNQWYKNRPGVVAAFTCLAAQESGIDLILAGKPPDALLSEAIAASPARARIVTLTDVDDDGIEILYSGAAMLLFPSLAEGFGWPVIEAQACGCPVVTADREPLLSVAGGAAETAPPDDPTALAAACRRALARRDDLRRAGLANASRYTPAAMAEGYLAAYRRVLA